MGHALTTENTSQDPVKSLMTGISLDWLEPMLYYCLNRLLSSPIPYFKSKSDLQEDYAKSFEFHFNTLSLIYVVIYI